MADRHTAHPAPCIPDVATQPRQRPRAGRARRRPASTGGGVLRRRGAASWGLPVHGWFLGVHCIYIKAQPDCSPPPLPQPPQVGRADRPSLPRRPPAVLLGLGEAPTPRPLRVQPGWHVRRSHQVVSRNVIIRVFPSCPRPQSLAGPPGSFPGSCPRKRPPPNLSSHPDDTGSAAYLATIPSASFTTRSRNASGLRTSQCGPMLKTHHTISSSPSTSQRKVIDPSS